MSQWSSIRTNYFAYNRICALYYGPDLSGLPSYVAFPSPMGLMALSLSRMAYNTLLWFISSNGGRAGQPIYNAPARCSQWSGILFLQFFSKDHLPSIIVSL